MEKYCEAVAAERAGWTERTAGQQPADALIKISAGEGSRACKPRVKPMRSAERRRYNQKEEPAKPCTRRGTGKEGSPAGRKPERLSPSGWNPCTQRKAWQNRLVGFYLFRLFSTRKDRRQIKADVSRQSVRLAIKIFPNFPAKKVSVAKLSFIARFFLYSILKILRNGDILGEILNTERCYCGNILT